MLAYHNDPTIKKEILEQLQGSNWNVSIEDFESRFGMPKVLVQLQNVIFKGLPNEEAKNWPIRFMSAIQVGADLSTVWREFALWLLIDPADGVIQYTHPGTDAHRVIMQVATLYQDGYTQQQMRDAAYDAAYADAHAHAYAAYAAAYAAYAAAYAAYAGAHATRDVVRDAAYTKMSNKLIELLQKKEVNHDHK